MTDSLEDTIARWLDDAGIAALGFGAELAASELARRLRAAGGVPPEPAGHDTPLFEGSPATFAKIVGDDILGPDLPERIAVYAVAAADGEVPAT